MIRAHHWAIALGVAVGVHLIALGLVLAHEPAEGAKAPGEQGIEIDLGMLGDLGSQTQNRQAAKSEQAAETPVEAPQPDVATPVAEPAPEAATVPDPVALPEPVIAKQAAELTVKPKPKPREAARPKPKTNTEIRPSQQPKPVTPQPEATPAATASRQQTSSEGKDSSDARRMTTGSQAALSTGGNPGAKQSYYALIAARLAQHKRYPIRARRKGEEGIAKLFFILDRKGSVIEYRLTESSGSKLLDRAVIDMLKSATPLPEFPADMAMETLTINIPVAFSIN